MLKRKFYIVYLESPEICLVFNREDLDVTPQRYPGSNPKETAEMIAEALDEHETVDQVVFFVNMITTSYTECIEVTYQKRTQITVTKLIENHDA